MLYIESRTQRENTDVAKSSAFFAQTHIPMSIKRLGLDLTLLAERPYPGNGISSSDSNKLGVSDANAGFVIFSTLQLLPYTDYH
ncbi:benzoate 4-monooxygenase cytochrome p450 [Moniliophthora roreri]|nr:benzoate 4-monooxygenase cytochrome p450 [Moniliophthora roreri]